MIRDVIMKLVWEVVRGWFDVRRNYRGQNEFLILIKREKSRAMCRINGLEEVTML